ncbi:major capsid protein [Solemya velum gill symbiont]|nr:major capsid protein [Solemya velum gill symbiont]
METTAVTTAITDAATAGGAIGAAVLVMLVGLKAYKWVRRAL